MSCFDPTRLLEATSGYSHVKRADTLLRLCEGFVDANEDPSTSPNFRSLDLDPIHRFTPFLTEMADLGNEQVAIMLLRVIKILSRKKRNRLAMDDALIAAVLKFLHLGRSPKICAEGANVILNACYERENVEVVLRHNGASPLVKFLNSDNKDLQANAAGALQSICFQSKGRGVVRNLDAIPHMINLLKSDSNKVKARAVGALHNMSSDVDSIRIIRRNGGISPLIELLRSPQPSICGSAAGALQNVSREVASRLIIRKSNAVIALADLLTSTELQTQEEEGDGSEMWARTSSSKGIWDKADAARRVVVAAAVIVAKSRDEVEAIVVDLRDEVVDVARRGVLVVAGSVANSRDDIDDVVGSVDAEGLVFVVVVAGVVVDVEAVIIAVVDAVRRVALVVVGTVVADVEAPVFAVAAEEAVAADDGVAIVVFAVVVASIGADLEDELVEDDSLDDAFGFLCGGLSSWAPARQEQMEREESRGKINGEKCEFGRTRVLYLGHEISAEGLKHDDAKVARICDWPRPQSVTEMRSFLGMTGYYRTFVKNYSIVAAPLIDLTRLDTPWEWAHECEAAFRHLKHALTHYEVLKLPDPDKPFIVTTDASQYGIGVVLAQQEGPKLRPVEYMSKKMSSHKLAKSTYEKELYAVYKALTHWRHYLLGRFFILRTDHQTLRWMRTQPVLSDALKRWIEVIEQYDFDPQYLKGEYNKVVDALSRRPDFSDALITEFDLTDNVTQSLVEAYPQDQFMSEIIRRLEVKDKKTSAKFELVNGLLFLEKAGNKCLCVPNSEFLRSLFLGECHDATSHFGYKKTAANLLQRFWRPTMMRDAQLYVETCQVCQQDKPRTEAPLGLLKPLPIPERPGESLSMDFMDTLITSKSGMRHIFVIVDRFSKYARLIAMPETAKTEYVIRMFKENWVRDFGLPKSIVSDRDVRFTSELWKAAAAEQGTQLQMTSGNHPEANGQAEQLNRVVQHLLRHYIKPNQVDWDEKLALIASLYNNAVHSATGASAAGTAVLLGAMALMAAVSSMVEHSQQTRIEDFLKLIRERFEDKNLARRTEMLILSLPDRKWKSTSALKATMDELLQCLDHGLTPAQILNSFARALSDPLRTQLYPRTKEEGMTYEKFGKIAIDHAGFLAEANYCHYWKDLQAGKRWQNRTISGSIPGKDSLLLTFEEGGVETISWDQVDYGLDEPNRPVAQEGSYAAVAARGEGVKEEGVAEEEVAVVVDEDSAPRGVVVKEATTWEEGEMVPHTVAVPMQADSALFIVTLYKQQLEEMHALLSQEYGNLPDYISLEGEAICDGWEEELYEQTSRRQSDVNDRAQPMTALHECAGMLTQVKDMFARLRARGDVGGPSAAAGAVYPAVVPAVRRQFAMEVGRTLSE
ncbi:hypothetical protein CBR_g50362 [Chara braunii]|uniref:Integrase catalytic domain-containing protein n=1 Tax=Chara braunii TaxID=69332 RepID=A0A388K5N4_CHABU|nr:hypothetical protein CBR_g50362 [Chara braunii]|eukprot:GBG65326.1 hypothetical protein CBR_g50362 [Chara braunii]